MNKIYFETWLKNFQDLNFSTIKEKKEGIAVEKAEKEEEKSSAKGIPNPNENQDSEFLKFIN